ncbi:MAG: hypothetical protein ACN6OP_24300 [Pseudomonadales bacterium]
MKFVGAWVLHGLSVLPELWAVERNRLSGKSMLGRLNDQANKESGMKKWIKRVVACGFLSMAVFGGTASASWCGTPCLNSYNACIARGTAPDRCEAIFESCLETLCPNG